jgi:cytochrome b
MKTNVWTLPTRIFHWYLAAGCVLAYILSDYTQVHAAIGLSVGTLLLFRLAWGAVGPRYSRFKDFPLSPKKVILFVKNIKTEEHLYTGHNPAAAAVMLLIMLTGICVAATGLLTVLSDDTDFFGPARFANFEGYHELHEFFVTILIILVGIHIVGLATNLYINKESKTILSMFSGFKKLPGINANLNLWQKAFAILAGIATVLVLVYVISL